MAMSENTMKIMDYLKENTSENLTTDDVAEATGLTAKQVVGGFNAFVKKGLGERVEAEVELVDGTHKKVKFLRLTDAGIAWTPESEAAAE